MCSDYILLDVFPDYLKQHILSVTGLERHSFAISPIQSYVILFLVSTVTRSFPKCHPVPPLLLLKGHDGGVKMTKVSMGLSALKVFSMVWTILWVSVIREDTQSRRIAK